MWVEEDDALRDARLCVLSCSGSFFPWFPFRYFVYRFEVVIILTRVAGPGVLWVFHRVFQGGFDDDGVARISNTTNGPFFRMLKMNARTWRFLVMINFRCRVVNLSSVFYNHEDGFAGIYGGGGRFSICLGTVTRVIHTVVECLREFSVGVFRLRKLLLFRMASEQVWLFYRTVTPISTLVGPNNYVGEGVRFFARSTCYFSVIHVIIHGGCHACRFRTSAYFFRSFFCHPCYGTNISRCSVFFYTCVVAITTTSANGTCGFCFRPGLLGCGGTITFGGDSNGCAGDVRCVGLVPSSFYQ